MKHLIPRDNEWDIYRTGNDNTMVFIGTVPDAEVDSLIDKWKLYNVEFVLHLDRGVFDD